MVEKSCMKASKTVSAANNTCRKRRSSPMRRRVSPRALPARRPRNPDGKANHATRPKRTDVKASPTNSHAKDVFASNPAVAGPKAQPALKAIRKAAKAAQPGRQSEPCHQAEEN